MLKPVWQWLTARKAVAWGVGGALVGVLLGPGSFWQWRQTELDVAGQDVRVAEAAIIHRDRLASITIEIINISSLWVKLRDCDPQQENFRVGSKMRELDVRLTLLGDDFVSLESTLARLEGREPRDIDLEFRTMAAPIVTLALIGPSGEILESTDPPPPPECPAFE